MMQAPRKFAPIKIETLEDVERVATLAVRAGWRREDETRDEGERIALATMIIMQGLEVGLPSTQALQQIMVDDHGRFLIWGDAVPALLWAAGFKLNEWFDGDPGRDTYAAHCSITRPDGTVIARSFSIDEAKRAGLWDDRRVVQSGDGDETIPNPSMWYRFWARMLQMRARGFCTRDGASDVTRGLYIREEYDASLNPVIVQQAQPDPVWTKAPQPPRPPSSAPVPVETVTVELTVEREPEADAPAPEPVDVAPQEDGPTLEPDAEAEPKEKPKRKPKPPRPPSTKK